MSLLNHVDFDKVLDIAIYDIRSAITGWLSGQPRDEVALMNRLTEKMGRRRRGCDVGIEHKVVMICKTSILHRKGVNQVDRFGSDVALSVSLNGTDILKTALFQLKRSSELNLSLEKRQLDDACIDRRTENRSFIFAVDDVRHCIRINSIEPLRSEFNPTQETKTFNSRDWDGLSQWIYNWLSCNIGDPSDPSDQNSVESLLNSFSVEPDQVTWGYQAEHELPDDFLPARSWLHMIFQKTPSKNNGVTS